MSTEKKELPKKDEATKTLIDDAQKTTAITYANLFSPKGHLMVSHETAESLLRLQQTKTQQWYLDNALVNKC